MKFQGTAHVFGDFINTDEHASEKYKPAGTPVEVIRQELFSGVKPGFVQSITPGDFIVAGKGFGTVSSRVDASMNIRAVGIRAVLAISFGMLFYRNAINVGLPCIECDTSHIRQGDKLVVDMTAGTVVNMTTNEVIKYPPFPPTIQAILNDGGLLPHIRKHNGYAL